MADDFLELPSQLFEEWAWTREALDLFARHYETNAPIPDALLSALLRSRAFGRALDVQRQLVYSAVDLEYQVREPGFDTTAVYKELQKTLDSFSYVEGTHRQTSAGGHYGYLWSQALARDVLARFRKEGLMNPVTAGAWRDQVLAKGGGEDARTLLRNFLGREPNENAFLEYLKGRD